MRHIDKPDNLNPISKDGLESQILGRTIITECEINYESIIVFNQSLKDEVIIISRCYFSNYLKLDKVTCKALEIKDSHFKTLELRLLSIESILIENCTIGELIINGDNVNFQLQIISSPKYPNNITSYIRSFYLKAKVCNISLRYTYFDDILIRSTESSSLEMFRCNTLYDRYGYLQKINDQEVFGKENEPSLSTIELNGSIEAVNFTELIISRILIKESTTLSLNIETSKVDKEIEINCDMVKLIRVNSSIIELLKVQASGLEDLRIINYFKGSVNLFVNSIRRIHLSKESDCYFSLADLSISNCQLLELLKIEECNIKSINLLEFNNASGALIIKKCYFQEVFNLLNSDIGKSSFNNVNFNKNLSFTFLNSEIIQSKFLTVDWMDYHRLNEALPSNDLSNQEKLQHYLTVKESYRQLKEISLNALNRYDALNFQRNEQRMYKEILWIKGNYVDHFLLKTNDLFNDFGLSYLKPLGWLLSVHLFLFWIMMIYAGEIFPYSISLLSGNFSWQTMLNAISQFFETLIPVHSTDYLNKSVGLPLLIDVFMRISSGYFIYYLISASRKFHISS